MTYNEIKKIGTKVDERDFYDAGIFCYTKEFWMCPNGLYVREEHSNANKYTGKTSTYLAAEIRTFDDYGMMYFAQEIQLSEDGYEKAMGYCKSLKQ
jgi:hypothetical protein